MSLLPTVVSWTEPLPETLSSHPFAPAQTLALYNPGSGTALARTRARRLISMLRERGYAVHPVGGAEPAPEPAEGIRAVIIMGGDGTLYDIISRLSANVNIAYYPAGTSNLFALNWQIPRAPDAWIALLDAGRTAPIRLGLSNGRPFASVASVGFDAMLVHRTRAPLKKMLAQGAFAVEFIHSYLEWNSPRYRVTIDGQPWPEDVLGIIVGRGPHYGGPFRVLPSDPHRPELAFAVLSGKSKWLLGKFAVGMLFETLAGMHGVTCGTATEIRVETDPPTYVQLDGDACGTTPVHFTVESRARRILA